MKNQKWKEWSCSQSTHTFSLTLGGSLNMLWGQSGSQVILKLFCQWFKSAVCILLSSVITNVSISAFSTIVLSFIVSYNTNRLKPCKLTVD